MNVRQVGGSCLSPSDVVPAIRAKVHESPHRGQVSEVGRNRAFSAVELEMVILPDRGQDVHMRASLTLAIDAGGR